MRLAFCLVGQGKAVDNFRGKSIDVGNDGMVCKGTVNLRTTNAKDYASLQAKDYRSVQNKNNLW